MVVIIVIMIEKKHYIATFYVCILHIFHSAVQNHRKMTFSVYSNAALIAITCAPPQILIEYASSHEQASKRFRFFDSVCVPVS